MENQGHLRKLREICFCQKMSGNLIKNSDEIREISKKLFLLLFIINEFPNILKNERESKFCKHFFIFMIKLQHTSLFPIRQL